MLDPFAMLALGLSVVVLGGSTSITTTARIVTEALVFSFDGRDALADVFEDLESCDIRGNSLLGLGGGGRGSRWRGSCR